ncbi:MAG: shikimate dehydrogenase [Burkholderiaceae bacterium]
MSVPGPARGGTGAPCADPSAAGVPGPSDQVDYVSGRSRVFGIVGDPIAQVRSPEMITHELRARGRDAVLVPLHVTPECFDDVLPALMRVRNLDGLVFTIPYKSRACALASELGANARAVGALNALARRGDGAWVGEMFDGLGCVEAFRRRGLSFAGRRVQLLGAGGAGSAIAVAIAHERPRELRVFDTDPARAPALVERVRAAVPGIDASAGPARVRGVDFLINATPAGMLGDPSLPVDPAGLAASSVVFDAVVKPEVTPLLAHAAALGCVTFGGREMMRGQIARIVDFFEAAAG